MVRAFKIFLIFLYSSVFSQKTSYEVLHLHTDKSTYIPGEIMWFKAYTVDGYSRQYVDYSSTVYVQLFNEKNQLVSSAKVENGLNAASGSIFIPKSLVSGNYQLKAFTLKMNTQGTEFSKKITIINPFYTPEVSVKNIESGYDFQVFGEGGSLVENLNGKIAYKLTNQQGKGVRHVLKIGNDGDTQKVISESNEFGMGSFVFKPEGGKNYTLYAVVNDKVVAKSGLPEVRKRGLQLKVTSQENKYSILISGSEDYRGASLSLQNETPDGEKKRTEFLLGTNLEYLIQINKSDLPQGTSLISLSNGHQVLQAERVVFAPIRDTLDLKVTLNKNKANKREELTLNFESLLNNNSEKSIFSMAVRRLDVLNSYPEDDIFTTLFLRKNLGGIIEKSDKFLQNPKALDDLLLTQGWRKAIYTQESEKRYHSVKLKFTDKETKEPVRNEHALLSITGSNVQVFPAMTNEEGMATFFVKNLYGEKQLATKLVSNRLSDVELQDVFVQSSDTLKAVTGSFNKQLTEEYAINIQAENSYFNRERATFNIPSKLDSIPFYGKADVSYKLDDYTRFVIMEEVLREYVKEVRVRKNRNDYSLRVVGLNLQNTFSDEPLLLLDGVPLANANEVINYDPLKVQKIEIVNSMVQFGNITYAGIINFGTYKNVLEGFKLDPSTTLLSYQAPQFERVFYTPKFASPQNSKLPDTRNVLLWEPNLKPGKSVNLMTSDFKGKYIIDLQGIDGKGNAGRAYRYFTVE